MDGARREVGQDRVCRLWFTSSEPEAECDSDVEQCDQFPLDFCPHAYGLLLERQSDRNEIRVSRNNPNHFSATPVGNLGVALLLMSAPLVFNIQ